MNKEALKETISDLQDRVEQLEDVIEMITEDYLFKNDNYDSYFGYEDSYSIHHANNTYWDGQY